MVVAVSFNKRLPPAAVGRGTLAEIMAKQKSAADAKNSYITDAQSPTIMQGIGNMANIGLNAFREGRAERDLGIQQARQRDLVGAVDPATGATQEQIAAMGEFDPKLMMEMWSDRAQKLRADAERDNWQPLTPDEYGQFQIDPAGGGWVRNITTGDLKKVGGKDSPLVQVGGETDPYFKKLDEAAGTDMAETLKLGPSSASAMGDINILRELGKVAPHGAVPAWIAKTIGQYDSAGAAYDAIIQRMAPTLHAPGTGSQSDIEYKGVLAGLPGLEKTPEANAMILDIMQQKATINQKMAKVADDVANRIITRAEGTAQLRAIGQEHLVIPEALQKMVLQAQEAAAPAPDPNGADTMTDEQILNAPKGTLNRAQLGRLVKILEAQQAAGPQGGG